VANVVFIAVHDESVPVFQYYALEPLAIFIATVLTYFNHTRNRTSSTILLLFWPTYLLALGFWLRTTIDTRRAAYTHIFILKGVSLGLGILSFLLECAGPEPEGPPEGKDTEESPIVTANIFSIWVSVLLRYILWCLDLPSQSFGWMTALMRKGTQQFITEKDLPPLLDQDKSANLGRDLKKALEK
jgi:hypothetical protein